MRRSAVKTGYLFKIGALTKPLQTYQGKIVSQYWCHKISSILYASNEMLWPHCHIFDEFMDQYQYLGNCPPTPPLTQR